jgi:hypothetical protein
MQRTRDSSDGKPAEGLRHLGNDALHRPGTLLESPAALHDVNERCIEALIVSARKDPPGVPSLVQNLRDLLLRLTPEARQRAARRSVLLTDMQFANPPWWRSMKQHPMRPVPLPSWRGSFQRPCAIQLARATLMLSWHSLRSHPQDAALFGVLTPVAEIIASLSLTEIDRIVERQFRHLRPRWEDRPAVWRALLLSAETEDYRRMRDFDLYSLQLVTGELWTSAAAARRVSG